MHPAYSVILFTTLSGAGYGLLIWLSTFAALGLVSADRWFGFVGFAAAFAMITAGLLTSTMHLGRPERAWRAFSQWRTSWLSREGVAAVATYVPSGLLALYWIIFAQVDGLAILLAVLTVVGAVLTVYCTGMIYGSLPTIRQWHHPLVPWVYIALSLATGALLFTLLGLLFGQAADYSVFLALVFVAAAGVLKMAYWQTLDWAPRTHTAESATGLGHLGDVRPLEPAHTQPNFVMREMGYQLGRQYRRLLRQVVIVFGFVVPLVLLVIAILAGGMIGGLAVVLAVISAGFGVGVERWLFFAEAEHVVTLYYHGGSA